MFIKPAFRDMIALENITQIRVIGFLEIGAYPELVRRWEVCGEYFHARSSAPLEEDHFWATLEPTLAGREVESEKK